MAITSLVFIPSARSQLKTKVPFTGTELHKNLGAALEYWMYLCGRWVDERKYEDFKGYITAWEKKITDLGGEVTYPMTNKRSPSTRIRFLFNLQDFGDVGAEMEITSKTVKIEVIRRSDSVYCGHLDAELGEASF